jgi:aminocarboxymuconate-semialdehyde decarboxylase
MRNRREFLKHVSSATLGLLFTGCGISPSIATGAPKRRLVAVGGRRITTVDVHCHVTIPEAWDLIKDDPNAVNGQTGTTDPASPKGPQLDPKNVMQRLAEMDQQGIDVQAVGINPFWYRTNRDIATRIIQLQNEKVAALCAAYPDRFAGMSSVSLQHPDLAGQQLEQALKKFGMRATMIGGSVNGEELSSPRFHPFWAKAEELGVLVFIHPQGFPEASKRFQGNGTLGNVIGNPLETTVALSHLIFEGTLDRFPGIKICAAHGGGFLASYIGRSDHCSEFNGDFPADCKPLKKRPSENLKQLYFDSIVFTGEGLRHIAAEVGANHIVLGTDYPYGMGDPAAVDHILNTPGFKDSERIAMLGGTAANLLGLK